MTESIYIFSFSFHGEHHDRLQGTGEGHAADPERIRVTEAQPGHAPHTEGVPVQLRGQTEEASGRHQDRRGRNGGQGVGRGRVVGREGE